MSAVAKAPPLAEPDAPAMPLNRIRISDRRVVRDFALLLGIALGIGVLAGLGMMLTVLLIA